MADEKNVFIENLAVLATPEGIQKYILGTKKNGVPRAVYDIIKDCKKKDKKKKKKHKKHEASSYKFYLESKDKKKKKKKNKHWHI